ncbi:unnamed protein product [Rhizophagus irregularis]|nr:unnamed protein product [Rhizophagus irregularis]
MFLILGEVICNSSCAVEYLTTDPPTSRQKAIRPIYLIDNNDDPYWKDHIEKYFNRPLGDEFNNLTYPNYFKHYEITKSRPKTTIRQIHSDLLNNFVVKRTTPRLVRFRYLKLQDGEYYFYQKLLLELSCRSEEELLSTFQTYREHWLFLHPELHETIQEITQEYLRTQQLKLDAQFSQTLDTLLNNLQDIIPPSTSELINIQLTSLRINPPILPQCSTLNLPNDQLHVLSTIKNILEPQRQGQDPRYFNALQEIRMGKMTLNTWNFLYQKAAEFDQKSLHTTLDITNIVGYKETANRINNMICNMLPINQNKFLIYSAVDFINDNQIFSAGQAYVALSRCPNWSNVYIAALNPSAFITDQSMIEEYERLEQIASTPLPL